MPNNLLLTAEEHSSLLARRTVVGPPSGWGFDRTGRATPKRDCCRQLHGFTVNNSSHCNNAQVMTHPIPQANELLFFSDWLITPNSKGQQVYLDESFII